MLIKLKTISVAGCFCCWLALSFFAAANPRDIEQALATLNALGILCHPNLNDLYPIPNCIAVSPGSELRHLRRKRDLRENPADATGEADKHERNATFYLINVGGATVSIFVVCVISAMFLGFLTLDPLDVQVKMRAAIDPAERDAAVAVFELVKQSHRLLVTLLFMNALAYECLPLFLDNLMPTYLTILFSVSLLLIFGEIVPSAIFTGPDQLVLASQLAPAVSLSMTLLRPVVSPLVKLLDWLVPSAAGEEGYNRAELSALVRIQYEDRMTNERTSSSGASPPRSRVPHLANQINAEIRQHRHPSADHDNFDSTQGWRHLKEDIMYAVAEKHQSSQEQGFLDGLISGNENDTGTHNSETMGGFQTLLQRTPSSSSVSSAPPFEQIAPPMERAEIKAVEGALKLKTGCAFDVYTPLRMIFAVPEDMVLNKQSMAEIYGQGYSRVPVYERQPPPNEHRIGTVKGVLMTRQLIMVNWDDERTVSSLPLYVPPCVSPRMNLVTLLSLLRKGGSLVAFICAGPHLAKKALREGRAIPIEAGFMGLVTLEDVLESVIQERIFDEEDIAERHLASAVLTRWAANKINQFMKQKVRRATKKYGGDPVRKVDGSLANGTPKSVANEKSPLLKR